MIALSDKQVNEILERARSLQREWDRRRFADRLARALRDIDRGPEAADPCAGAAGEDAAA